MENTQATIINRIFEAQVYLAPLLELSDQPGLSDQELTEYSKFEIFRDEELGAVAHNFFYNAKLWALEDKARDPSATDIDLAKIKRKIDQLNQKRNDYIEKMNQNFSKNLSAQNLGAPIYSESPGSIIDRLSILELRIKSVRSLLKNQTLPYENLLRHGQKLSELLEFRDDLRSSLTCLINLVEKGVLRVKFQGAHKLYNNPNTNPYLIKNKIPGPSLI